MTSTPIACWLAPCSSARAGRSRKPTTARLPWRLAARQPFRLILLDISMPGLSGEETCAGLRKILLTPAPRIIAYTAHAFPEDRKRLLSGGFRRLLVKPINRQAFDVLIAGLVIGG